MNDWNQNGKYDEADQYLDYKGASQHGSGASSDLWIWILLAIVVGVCPPLAIVIIIIACICGK